MSVFISSQHLLPLLLLSLSTPVVIAGSSHPHGVGALLVGCERTKGGYRGVPVGIRHHILPTALPCLRSMGSGSRCFQLPAGLARIEEYVRICTSCISVSGRCRHR